MKLMFAILLQYINSRHMIHSIQQKTNEQQHQLQLSFQLRNSVGVCVSSIMAQIN